MKELFKIYKKYWFSLLVVFLTMLVPATITSYQMTVVKDVFETHDIGMFNWYLILLVVSLFMDCVVSYFFSSHFIKYKISETIRKTLYDKFVTLKRSFFVNKNNGDLTTIMNKCDYLAYAGYAISSMLTYLLSTMFLFFMIASMNLTVAFIVIACSIVFTVVYYRFFIKIKKAKKNERIIKLTKERGALIDDTLKGHAVVTSLNLKSDFNVRHNSITDTLTDIYHSIKKGQLISRSIVIFAIEMISALFVMYSCFVNQTPSDYVIFIYIGNIMMKIDCLLNVLIEFMQEVPVSLALYKEVMDQEPEIDDGEIEIDHFETLEFRNVSFEYEEDQPVLQNINLKINHGQHIGICGPSGSGKSSLANLILRFYDVKEGQILINGYDIKDIKRSSLYKVFGLVNQDTFLFTDTIIENIRYGDPNASYREIIDASKKAYCHDFVMELKNRYWSKVGANGIRLSGGQKQRITIARTFLRNPDVLVLDEATSSLDNESESYIQDTIRNHMSDKTIIAIAHRLTTIQDSDIIFVIKDGMIAEYGNHEELLVANGIYKSLHR